MSWWRAKKRAAGNAPLRRRLEVLEPRALLSGQEMFVVPVKVVAPAAVSVFYASTHKTENTAFTPVKDSVAVKVSLTDGAGMWLNLRSDAQLTVAKSAVSMVHHEYVFGRGRHDIDADVNATARGDSFSVPWGMNGDRARIQIAPFDASLDKFAPPDGVTLLPGVAVSPAPGFNGGPGATPARTGGAVFVSAANALIQALASSYSVSARAENAAAYMVATVDARHSTTTSASRTPAAPLPATPAVTRSQLTGNPDGGLIAIGGAAGVHRGAADAAFEGETLTDAELEWLTQDVEEKRAIAAGTETATPAVAAQQPSDAIDISLASFDEGMVALPNGTNSEERTNRVIAPVASTVDIAVAASMFQAKELGFETPRVQRIADAPPKDLQAAAMVGISGDAAAPEEAGSQLSQRLVVGAFVGLAGFEFLRRRRTNLRYGDS